ncbi:MAG: Methyl-accepting chemotaxis protein I [Candidatus Erwinia impunctatus]|nr:Methyl-accepting chemotaxis protein I [Culicoides impunctatus]
MNAVRSNINRTVIAMQNNGVNSENANNSIQASKDELVKIQKWYDAFNQYGEIAGIDPALTQNLDVSYKKFYAELQNIINLTDKRDPAILLSYNLTPTFNLMLKDYDAWRTAANEVTKKTYISSESLFNTIVLILISILVVIVLVTIVCWYVLRSTLLKPLNNALFFINNIAHGDLSHDIESDPAAKNEMSTLIDGLQTMKESIYHTVKTVRESSEIISVEIIKLVDGNDNLSSRTEQQAASLEETAASMEQITHTVSMNADNANQAAAEAIKTAESAKEGGRIVSNVSNTINEMEISANKISEVTNLIKNIAFQTNILALNAAVEAARAGESGKGFAVVAGEVRNLAQNCANAAKDVDMLIKDSSTRVQESSHLAQTATSSINEVVNFSQNVSDIINEISVASKEQESGISQIGVAITELDKVTQLNYGLVQQASASCNELKDQIAILHQSVIKFKLS